MTHEEMERTMQFILEHQAKFSADLGSINETLAKHNEAIVDLVRISRALVDNQMAHEGQMSELRTEMRELAQISHSLIDNQMTHEGQMSELRTEMRELARTQRETDERLSTFITVVERYISGRNGGAFQP